MIRDRAVVLYVIKYLGVIYGKKALQKIIYFLSEKLQLSFNFRLYWFGPFSRELANLYDELRYLKLIEIEVDISKKYPEIKINQSEEEYIEGIIENNLDDQEKRIINDIADKLKSYSPRKLELLATVHFIKKYITKSSKGIIKTVKEIKESKFSDAEIREAINIINREFS
ncbi:MAG: hypothetical protein ACP6IQ_05495 [Candidatus Njordarchaeia archaeon]